MSQFVRINSVLFCSLKKNPWESKCHGYEILKNAQVKITWTGKYFYETDFNTYNNISPSTGKSGTIFFKKRELGEHTIKTPANIAIRVNQVRNPLARRWQHTGVFLLFRYFTFNICSIVSVYILRFHMHFCCWDKYVFHALIRLSDHPRTDLHTASTGLRSKCSLVYYPTPNSHIL